MRIIQFGLGAIGIECARAIARTPGLKLVGAVDVDPGKSGAPLAGLLGGAALPAGLRVSSSLSEALKGRRADAVIHTTSSTLAAVYPQLAECAAAGLPVVSSTEELSFPDAVAPRLAAQLDRLAVKHGVAILGAGVNPGFVMDLIPVVASGASMNVVRIEVERVLDAGRRRKPFQEKVCVGRRPAEARRALASGGGHVGLELSARLIARGCGIPFDTMHASGRPVIAKRRMRSALGPVEPGSVAGLSQEVRCTRGGRTVIRLRMVMAVGAGDPHDSAVIHGDPKLTLRFDGGIFGDTATVATLLNALPGVVEGRPGLHTVLDLPPAGSRGSSPRG